MQKKRSQRKIFKNYRLKTIETIENNHFLNQSIENKYRLKTIENG